MPKHRFKTINRPAEQKAVLKRQQRAVLTIKDINIKSTSSECIEVAKFEETSSKDIKDNKDKVHN